MRMSSREKGVSGSGPDAQPLAGCDGVDFLGFEDALFVRRVNAALMGGQKTRSDLHADGAEQNAAAMPRRPRCARGDDRERNGVADLRTSAIVVSSPMCPPESQPSAMTAEALMLWAFLACATEATTGMTQILASSHMGMNFEGMPAPVVTMRTPSSATTCATSSTNGLIIIMFTPNGFFVSVLARRIWPRSQSAFAFIAEIRHKPSGV